MSAAGFVPTYRPTGSALHAVRAGVAVAYVAAACAPALVFSHPLVLASALAGVTLAGLAAGVGPELARAARLALPLALLFAAINPLVSREGLTLLVEGPVVPVLGALDITLEATVQGAVAGLRVLVVLMAVALYSAAVDPDAVLRLFRRLSFRSALTAALATRLVPVLGRDAQRLSAAYALRAATPRGTAGGRLAPVRRGAILTRALAAGSLDRALDLAAALEVRGYALAPHRGPRGTREPWSRHEFSFALSALAVIAVTAGAWLAGVAPFDAYPQLETSLGAAECALAVAIPALLLAPFAVAARRRRRP
jgi:energy-coupling factor transport system permease protein